MFYKSELSTKILVPAIYLGPNLHESIKAILCNKVEGKVELEHNSFVIAVVDVLSLDTGKIQESGDVLFVVDYEALVERCHVDEVVHGVVESIMPPSTVKLRIGALHSRLRLISSKSSGEEYKYDPDIKGLIGTNGESAFKEGSVAKIRITSYTVPANTIKVISELV